MVLSGFANNDRVLPGMRERHWGRVITSTSSGVVTPIPNLGISNALRSSLLGWSKTLAREVARDGVTANIVVPGRIGTDRIRFLDQAKAQREGRSPEDVANESTSSIPVRRYGDPAEYAAAVAFLASARLVHHRLRPPRRRRADSECMSADTGEDWTPRRTPDGDALPFVPLRPDLRDDGALVDRVALGDLDGARHKRLLGTPK
jgi:NAD(P)-dependent dehydrogenase (short-subunit alcohol dehydrogenase family)